MAVVRPRLHRLRRRPPPADTTAPTVPAGVTAAAAIGDLDSGELDRVDGRERHLWLPRIPQWRRDGRWPPCTTTSYTDTGLAASTAYSYTVVAVDAAATPNVSAASAAASATTPGGPRRVRIAAQRVFPQSHVDRRAFTAARAARHHPLGRRAAGRPRAWRSRTRRASRRPATCSTSAIAWCSATSTGLLGLAFHPNYPTDPRAYAAYTHEVSAGVIVLRISEFTTADGGATLNPASRADRCSRWRSPAATTMAATCCSGPDGFLYLGIGDGGNDDSASGVAGNGQLDQQSARQDPANRRERHAPARADTAFRPAIHSPPIRCATSTAPARRTAPRSSPGASAIRGAGSFDRQGGQFWLGDVGSHTREEVNRVVLGGNYGWRCFEGTLQTALNCGTPTTPLLPPVAEYVHPHRQSPSRADSCITAPRSPALVGRYVFADYSSGHHLEHRDRHGAHAHRWWRPTAGSRG